MEIQANRVNQANAAITANIPKDFLQTKVDKIALKAGKNMKVDGFRKGKVPLSIIKKRFGEQLEKDAQGEVLREVLDKALADLSIDNADLIGDPSVVKFDTEGEKIDVEMKVAIKPEIDAGDYQALIPDYQEPEITDAVVEERIGELANSSVPFEKSSSKRKTKKNDQVLLDFQGFIGEKEIKGGSAEDFSLQIGSGSLIPGFEDQLIGMKPGEESEINVTFPEDYQNKELAGQEARFLVKIKAHQEKPEAVIDDELAKKLMPNDPEATLAILKEKVAEQLKNEKLGELFNEDLKPKVLEEFAAKINFDLPEFVVEQEVDLAFRNSLGQMDEATLEAIKQNPEKIKEEREKYRENAEKSVKVTFIVDAIAKKENIEVNDNELLQAVYHEAMQNGQDPKKTLEFYKERGLLPAIKMSLVEDKLLTHLLTQKNAPKDASESKKDKTEES